MNGLSQLINSMSGYLIITGIIFLGILIIFSVTFSGSPKKAKSGIQSAFVFKVFLDIVIFLIISRLMSFLPGYDAYKYDIVGFSFLIIFSILTGLNPIIKLRDIVPKSKTGGSLKDIYSEVSKENTSFSLDFLLISALLLAPMYLLGNGSLNSLLILLFVSVLIVSFGSIVIFPLAFKIFDRNTQ